MADAKLYVIHKNRLARCPTYSQCSRKVSGYDVNSNDNFSLLPSLIFLCLPPLMSVLIES